MTVVTELVMMAAHSGEIETVTDVDVLLFEMGKSRSKDVTWHEVVDALLEVRQHIMTQREEPEPAPA